MKLYTRCSKLHTGVRGIAALHELLCSQDAENSGFLTREEFRRAAFAAALGLGDIDIEQILHCLRADPNKISIAAVMRAVTGELTQEEQVSERRNFILHFLCTAVAHGTGRCRLTVALLTMTDIPSSTTAT